jgi:phosphate transport system protein
MSDKHLSSQFDSELNGVSPASWSWAAWSSRRSARRSTRCPTSASNGRPGDPTEQRVNAMESRSTTTCLHHRPAPAHARDLRLLIAISKTTANLERVGDEADKIARMVKSHHRRSGVRRALPVERPAHAADLASGLLRKALDAFARLDTDAALSILKRTTRSTKEFDGFCAQAHHLHDGRPAHHLASLDLLFLAKAIERIGDHAKNVADSSSTSSRAPTCATPRWSRSSRRLALP